MKKLLSLVFVLLGATTAIAGSHRIVRIHRPHVHVIKRHVVPVIRPVVVQRTIRPVIIKRIQPKSIVKRVRYVQPTAVVTRVYHSRPVIGPAFAGGIIGAAVGGIISSALAR